jgi:Na+/H+ antiporter NhaD/arsenite permease-like protein
MDSSPNQVESDVVVGLVIFAITYALISARRFQKTLDRPAAALLGAVACVAFRVLSPEQALGAVDPNTILLLFGVMGMGAFLAIDGFFDHLEGRLAQIAQTPTALIGLVVWGAGVLSALITNDAVCVLGAPLVCRMIRKHGLPPVPFLLALCSGANTGSVATLVGNPQNMLCGILGGLEYRTFAGVMVPVAALSLAINHGLLWLYFRRRLATATLASVAQTTPLGARNWSTLGVIGATAVAYTAGTHLAWTSAAGFAVLMLLHRRSTSELWSHIDWPLLLFFSGLFVVVGGLAASGAPAWFFEQFPLEALGNDATGFASLSALFLVGSNIVSNVPFILVIRDQMSTLPNAERAWELLAMASTFAGNLTLLGSVANVIVAESAREWGGLGFREHFRFGAPLALITTALGTVWLSVWP